MEQHKYIQLRHRHLVISLPLVFSMVIFVNKNDAMQAEDMVIVQYGTSSLNTRFAVCIIHCRTDVLLNFLVYAIQVSF